MLRKVPYSRLRHHKPVRFECIWFGHTGNSYKSHCQLSFRLSDERVFSDGFVCFLQMACAHGVYILVV